MKKYPQANLLKIDVPASILPATADEAIMMPGKLHTDRCNSSRL